MSDIVLELSPTERIKAVIDKGKIAYEKTTDAKHEFRNGRMRTLKRPRAELIQGFISADLLKTKPKEVMAFFQKQIFALQNTPSAG